MCFSVSSANGFSEKTGVFLFPNSLMYGSRAPTGMASNARSHSGSVERSFPIVILCVSFGYLMLGVFMSATYLMRMSFRQERRGICVEVMMLPAPMIPTSIFFIFLTCIEMLFNFCILVCL